METTTLPLRAHLSWRALFRRHGAPATLASVAEVETWAAASAQDADERRLARTMAQAERNLS